MRKINKEDMLKQIPFKMVEAKEAARIILRGVRRNKAMVVFPGYAKFFWFLSRISARLIAPLDRKTVKDFRATRRD
jgi:short-subunit dehydrogenase